MKRKEAIMHKSTVAPWECGHCGMIWYGMTGGQTIAPDGMTLCINRWSALDRFLYQQHRELYQHMGDELIAVHAKARVWIANNENKPGRLFAAQRFHSSVPHWMRSAVDAGMVKQIVKSHMWFIARAIMQLRLKLWLNLHFNKHLLCLRHALCVVSRSPERKSKLEAAGQINFICENFHVALKNTFTLSSQF